MPSAPSAPDTDRSFSLRIERSMRGLATLGGWVDSIVADLHLAPGTDYALRLCLEEAAANVVMHGVPAGDDTAGFVTLRVEPLAGMLRVTVEDRCGAFDPLQTPAPQLPADLETAKVGGMGIHLMRHYARDLQYERAEGINRLTLLIAKEDDDRTAATCRTRLGSW